MFCGYGDTTRYILECCVDVEILPCIFYNVLWIWRYYQVYFRMFCGYGDTTRYILECCVDVEILPGIF